MDNDGNVVSCDGIELETPIPVGQFVTIMQKTRQAVEIYFGMLLEAEQGLNKFLRGDDESSDEDDSRKTITEVATKFKEQLLTTIANERGLEMRTFMPTTTEPEQSAPLDEVKSAKLYDGKKELWKLNPQDLHNHFRASTVWDQRVKEDALIQQLVVLCEEFILENNPVLTRPEILRERWVLRRHFARTTQEMWKHIVSVFENEGCSEALDPSLEAQLPFILIASGWRMITAMRWSTDEKASFSMLPFGRGVSGCFWAKTEEDDHPFWTQ